MVAIPTRQIYDVGIPVGESPQASSAGYSQVGAAASALAGTAEQAAMLYARKQMEFDERAKVAKQNMAVAQMNAQALLDLQTAATTALEGDPAQAERSFTAEAAKMRQRYQSQVSDPEVWQAFEQRYPSLVTAKQLDIREGARKRIVDAGRASLDQTLATLGTAAAGATTQNERDLIIAQAQDAIQGAVHGGLYWPEKAGDLERSWRGMVDDVDARRAIMSDPAKAVEVLSGVKGWENIPPERRQTLWEAANRAAEANARDKMIAQERTDRKAEVAQAKADREAEKRNKEIATAEEVDARRLIMDNPEDAARKLATTQGWEHVEPERRQTLLEAAVRAAEANEREKRALTAQAERDRKQEQSWSAVTLIDGIKDGRYDNPDKAIAEFEASTGFATPSLKMQAENASRAYELQRRKATEDVDRVRTLLNAGVPLDPRQDRKGVNQYWRSDIAPKLQDAQQAEDAAAAFAGQTGMLPEDVEGAIVGGIRGPNVGQKVQAAAMLSKIEARSPGAASDVPENTRRYARLLNDYLSSGATPQEAVDRVEQQMNPPPGVVQYRREMLTANYMANEYVELGRELRKVPGIFNDNPDPAKPTDVADVDADLAAALPAISADYADWYKPAFEAHGDAAAARKEALNKVRRVWGVTTVDGTRRWLKYAPEVVYGVEDKGANDAKWIGEQLRTSVAALPTMKGAADPRLILQPDTTSAMEYRETGNPKYLVMQAKDGVLDVVIGEDGRPFRWAPQSKGTAERDAELARLREKAKVMRDARDVQRQAGSMGDQPAMPGF